MNTPREQFIFNGDFLMKVVEEDIIRIKRADIILASKHRTEHRVVDCATHEVFIKKIQNYWFAVIDGEPSVWDFLGCGRAIFNNFDEDCNGGYRMNVRGKDAMDKPIPEPTDEDGE